MCCSVLQCVAASDVFHPYESGHEHVSEMHERESEIKRERERERQRERDRERDREREREREPTE